MSASFYVSLSVKALFKHNDKTIDTHLLWCWKHIYYLQLWQGFGQLQNSRALLLIIFLHLQLQLQCTMGQAVEIDSLEVHKSKQILHAHLWSENFHSFCKWSKTTKILTWYQILIFKMHILCFFLGEKLKGGSDKVEILVTCNLDNLQQKSPK